MNRVAVRGVEPEAGAAPAEIALVNHHVAARCEDRGVGDDVVRRGVKRIPQPPAAKVHRRLAGVVQLDGVLERRVGMRQHLVDDDVREGQIVAAARRRGDREIDQCRRAVRQAAA